MKKLTSAAEQAYITAAIPLEQATPMFDGVVSHVNRSVVQEAVQATQAVDTFLASAPVGSSMTAKYAAGFIHVKGDVTITKREDGFVEMRKGGLAFMTPLETARTVAAQRLAAATTLLVEIDAALSEQPALRTLLEDLRDISRGPAK